MCLGEYATVVELLDGARARVRYGDGAERDVSLAVLVAEGTTVSTGDTVAVSIGMALHVTNDPVDEVVEDKLVNAPLNDPVDDEEVTG